jgi:hypothetical protein
MTAKPSPTRRHALAMTALAAGAPAFLATHAVEAAEEKKTTGDTLDVELPGIIIPIAHGRMLRDYLFLTLSVRAGDFATSEHLRQKHFLVRDSIVRALSTRPVQAGPRPGTYDQATLIPMLSAAIARSGPRLRIASVRIKDARFMRG